MLIWHQNWKYKSCNQFICIFKLRLIGVNGLLVLCVWGDTEIVGTCFLGYRSVLISCSCRNLCPKGRSCTQRRFHYSVSVGRGVIIIIRCGSPPETIENSEFIHAGYRVVTTAFASQWVFSILHKCSRGQFLCKQCFVYVSEEKSVL